ncbi:hypothetical protein B0I35DRAFT_98435 [Stachybotrys elegans]|uniref:CorA-like transporter domain-containing protein n=1 Tax=Stachybotrys elegans TaxID=80388 RepID=A0A8K0SHW6_9HYPO|nr:hypothetical protein B0I35DRAFT_98435 [Stachybotrys elegans]
MTRHVFLNAGNSEKPLNCTLNSFLYICAYHQVSPEFVDMLFSFGVPRSEIVQYHRPQCYQEYSAAPTESVYTTPQLGRSGWELRNCYKLSGMEKSDGWTMRQMAVYHAFDLSNGRSFFITVKANHSHIRSQIQSINKGVVPDTIQNSFSASLEAQLLGFHWSTRGWKEHIDVLENRIRQIYKNITSNPIGSADDGIDRGIIRRVNTMSSSTPGSPVNERGPPPSQHLLSRRFTPRLSTNHGKNTMLETKGKFSSNRAEGQEADAIKDAQEVITKAVKRLGDLEDFPFRGLQNLNFDIQKLTEAKLVMDLNARALQDIREYFKSIWANKGFPEEIDHGCKEALESFLQRIKGFERIFSNECMRVDALLQLANEGKALVSKRERDSIYP